MINLLLFCHYVADFSLQTSILAQKKAKEFNSLLLHSSIHALVFLLPSVFFVQLKRMIIPFLIIVISHFIIDWSKIEIEKRINDKEKQLIAFIIDQILHVVIIISVGSIFKLETYPTIVFNWLQQSVLNHSVQVYLLTYAVLWEPSAIFIKRYLELLSSRVGSIGEENPKVGRIIGKLERVVIATLVLNNQLGAIGFVLTAKTIARFKQLEDREFAERYLVGTLLSVAIALIISITLKNYS